MSTIFMEGSGSNTSGLCRVARKSYDRVCDLSLWAKMGGSKDAWRKSDNAFFFFLVQNGAIKKHLMIKSHDLGTGELCLENRFP